MYIYIYINVCNVLLSWSIITIPKVLSLRMNKWINQATHAVIRTVHYSTYVHSTPLIHVPHIQFSFDTCTSPYRGQGWLSHRYSSYMYMCSCVCMADSNALFHLILLCWSTEHQTFYLQCKTCWSLQIVHLKCDTVFGGERSCTWYFFGNSTKRTETREKFLKKLPFK